MLNKLKPLLMAGIFVLPVDQMTDWQVLEYSSLKPNQVSFSDSGMKVSVNHSASPIIYPFPEPKTVRQIEVEGSLSNLLDLPDNPSGENKIDDFSLKIGLVIKGEKTLSGFQHLFSPKWVKTLFDLAPEGTGVDHIHFLSAVQSPNLVGNKSSIQDSDLFYDEYIWLIDKPGNFALKHRLDQPLTVIAIWISINGDDSLSKYTTVIKKLTVSN
jgi:hypothetical protein